MLLYTISELIALHNILVLLLSCNALANNALPTLPSLRVFCGCWLNPLFITSVSNADSSLTLKLITSATASQVKLTVELRVVLTDWGWTVISTKYD